jgi:thiosulfate/3-mercaptopyruvate sulfurtransferase
MKNFRKAGELLLLIAILAAMVSSAAAECIACKEDAASQQDLLNKEYASLGEDNASVLESVSSTGGLINPKLSRASNPGLQKDSAGNASSSAQADEKEDNGSLARSQRFASVLVPLSSVEGAGIVVDIRPNSTEYIPGAINIPYTEFLKPGGALKSASEIAKVLGQSGISQEDDVLLYGECQPCGGGPSASTYVLWIFEYLGHKNVKLLDGGIDDWVAEKLPTTTEPATLAPKSYTPELRTDLLSTYEYVHSKTPQIIDGRTAEEFEAGSIPGAVNIPYSTVLEGKKIKDEASVQSLFSSLDKSRPVVVYTNTGVKASMLWLPLTLLGYDARLYTWQDWDSHQPKLNIDIDHAQAQPNPASPGDVVQITVVFKSTAGNASSSTSEVSVAAANVSNETVLTVKGCATCGFGSPQGYADLSSSNGTVQIGSASQAQRSAADSGFSVIANVLNFNGDQVSRVVMKRISGDEFTGLWNANVAAGSYSVNVVAASGEITKTFLDVLDIEVSGTSKYKNLGNQ